MKSIVYFLLILFLLSLFPLNFYAQTDPGKETPRIENSCLIATVDDIKSAKIYDYYIGDVETGIHRHFLCEIEFTNFTPEDLNGPYWGYSKPRFELFLNDKLLFNPAIDLYGKYCGYIINDLYLDTGRCDVNDVFTLETNFFYNVYSWLTDEEIEQARIRSKDRRTLRKEQYEVFLQYLREAGKLIDLTNIELVTHHEPSDISIYPNPTTGELRIRNYETTFGDNQLGIEKVEIFDIVGKKLSTVNFRLSTINSIDISHLPEGIYFVRVMTEKGVVTKKIVKR